MDPSELVALLEGSPNVTVAAGFTEHDIDSDGAKAALECLLNNWTTRPEKGLSMASVAAARFGVNEQFEGDELVPYGPSGLQTLFKKKQFGLVRLRYHFVRLGLMDLDEGDDVAGAIYRSQFIKIHECLQRLYDCLMTNLLTHKALDPQWAMDCPTSLDPYYIVPFDFAKVPDFQKCIIFALEQLQKRNLRRYRGCCYEEIESPPCMIDGKPKVFKTRAWRRLCDISEFVNRYTARLEVQSEMWNILAIHRKSVIDHLQKFYDLPFPDLEPDRHWHSFPNGMYNTIWKTFFPWGHSSITSDVTACKYHEAYFPEAIVDIKDWHDIPTPHFHRILATQLAHVEHLETDAAGTPKRYTEESAAEENEMRAAEANGAEFIKVEAGDKILVNEGDKVIDWAYILLGRLLFEVNQKDSWQIMPMFIGRAGTGKSLILSTVAKFFDDADVAVVSNDAQKGFGLETVYNKKLWMVKEVKHDFAIDQAQLQSMITGEEMSIQRKNLTAEQVVWKAPGVLAGNELANWHDNSGSMSRRMILFYFHKKVSNSDPNLGERLEQELPYLIHKCNKAYAQAVARYGESDIWAKDPHLRDALAKDPEAAETYRGSLTILPSYFHYNKSSLKQQTHLMENFLANRDEVQIVRAISGRGMPYEADVDGRPSFKTIANAFFKKQDVKGGFLWSKEDRYRATFDDYGLEIRRLTQRDVAAGRNRYADHDYPADTNWIFGVVPKGMEDD